MPIKGHVDDMEGSYVVGWAASVPDTGNCAITITDDNGQLLAKGRASRHRADLAAVGLGRTTLAFRIPVPHIQAPRTLRIFANGEELPGSPLATGPGLFDGHCWMEGYAVTGWVSERRAEAEAPFISIVNHLGIEVGRGPSHFEKDSKDPLFTPARFAIPLDDSCFGAGEMPLSVFVNDQLLGRTACNLALRGNIEIISATQVMGWLVAPDFPQRSFELEVYRDGALAGLAKCEHERVDVRNIFPDCGPAGFDTQLDPATHTATEAVTLSLRFPGSDRELFESPYVIASRPAAVVAVYEAARLANTGLPGLSPAARAVMGQALREYLTRVRNEDGATLPRQAQTSLPAPVRGRVAIIIPIYRGVAITKACIESVLAHRGPTDLLILINDHSPDADMAGMLAPYDTVENVLLLTNEQNLGFVRTVNRGMALAEGMHAVLLNSDTVMHAGGLDELLRVAGEHPEIGTVTAISNNATIFSYPHTELRQPRLDDISWPELAALALRENAGRCVDVPTGHGFCMLIKAEVIRRIGLLDEGFGRGYGEENDLCARTAALGYRNVAAGGALVEHKESISFANERASLLAQNLPRLNALYPEYTPVIMEFERVDGMRPLRWALDRARLLRARAAGARFTLVVANALEGGTPKAIRDIESYVGYGGAETLTLRVTSAGLLELECKTPLLRASFLASETDELLAVLEAAAPGHVLVHQLLGFPLAFLTAFQPWLAGRHSVFWAHDFYPLCPRVTMIDAIGRFCGGADADTCARCLEMGGAHENAALDELSPAEHRALFAGLLGSFTNVLTPSENAATYLRRIFPGVTFQVQPHPEPATGIAAQPRAGTDDELVLLGAIGTHKGSQKLLEIAQRARLTHPHLHFRIIGYTNIDKQLKAIGNVTITGKYKPEELPRHLAEAKGRLGLFLPVWPETYSYTLSELVRHGFIPLVPDIGAPAERVRAAKYGVVFPFPIDPETVLKLIDGIASGEVKPFGKGATPDRFFAGANALKQLAGFMGMEPEPAIA
jgi:GT2 family glycosyltransferase